MINIQEKKAFQINAWAVVLVVIALFACALFLFLSQAGEKRLTPTIVVGLPLTVAARLACPGFFLIHPNESKVFTFLGKYAGSAREPGFHWTNPFVVKKKVTYKNFVAIQSETASWPATSLTTRMKRTRNPYAPTRR